MEWELRNDSPIWLQLVELLTRRIVSAHYPAGTRMPSVRDLAAEFGVNPNTMQRALSALEDGGLVEAQRSSGRFVTQDAERIAQRRNDLAQSELEAFLERMAQLGYGREDTVQLLNAKGDTL